MRQHSKKIVLHENNHEQDLLKLAKSYQYGRNGVERNIQCACSWYEQLLRGSDSECRREGHEAYAQLLEAKSTSIEIGVVVAIRFAKTAAQVYQTPSLKWPFLRAIVAQAAMNIDPWESIIAFEDIKEIAIEALKTAQNNHDRADILSFIAHFHKVGCYGFPEDSSEAIALLEEALELEDPPSKPFIYRELGNIYIKKKNYAMAKRHYESALSCDDYSEVRNENSFFGLIYFNLGVVFLKNDCGLAPLLANAQECCNKAAQYQHPRVAELQFAIDQATAVVVESTGEQVVSSFFASL